jgi:tRNA-splicing ligase RtcB (3'-phosphate/5'-hydroxy nucleic acid ligase)
MESGRAIQDDLAAHGILVRSPSTRGIAEEAPGAYKDVGAVVAAAEQAGLARRVARLRPLICNQGLRSLVVASIGVPRSRH